MIEIGTNFSYKGPRFLDERHGIARTKEDLRNWTIPIPEGFEVYLDSNSDSDGGPAWYTYSSRNQDESTGHFKRRIDVGLVENIINDNTNIIYTEINNIQSEIDNMPHEPNLTLDVIPSASTNTNIQVIGNNVLVAPEEAPIVPIITWNLKNYGASIDINDIRMFVNNVEVEPINPWYGDPISSNQTYSLIFIYNDQNFTSTVSYEFRSHDWNKYLGVSSSTTISSLSNIQIKKELSGWGTTDMNFEGTVDCSIGNNPSFPYYILPESAFDINDFRMYVGGLGTTDYIVQSQSININGVSYKAIRTGYIQTGVLQLRYE